VKELFVILYANFNFQEHQVVLMRRQHCFFPCVDGHGGSIVVFFPFGKRNDTASLLILHLPHTFALLQLSIYHTSSRT
jgi:hypothetical protein